jgi:hypothetical protein
LLSLRGVVPPSLMFYGRVGLVRIGGHARAPAKSCESRVYDNDRVSYLSCAQRSRVPCSSGGIRHSVHDILRVRIWCVIPPISLLLAAVLWLGAASLDSFGDLAYGSLRDPV